MSTTEDLSLPSILSSIACRLILAAVGAIRFPLIGPCVKPINTTFVDRSFCRVAGAPFGALRGSGRGEHRHACGLGQARATAHHAHAARIQPLGGESDP